MSIVKNYKKYSNEKLADIISLMTHIKSRSNNTHYNLSKRNTLEKINNKSKNHYSSKKNKNNSKDSGIFINNYLTQKPYLNTEGNENNIKNLKFSMDFFNNKIEELIKINNNKSTRNKKRNTKINNDNFRKGLKNNLINEIVKKPKKVNDSSILNKKNNSNFQFTRFITNNNSYNKKLIETNSNNEYNKSTTQNFSHTQSYFNQNSKKNNKIFLGYSENHNYNSNREDLKKRSAINNKIIKDKKMKNFSGLILQISPPLLPNNKLSHIQNYFRNIHKNKKEIFNQKVKQYNKEKKILTTEVKELNQDTEDFILKENSNYLLVSKNPTQITNIIEKKENNKYINNYFNICESTNVEKKKNFDKKNNDKNSDDENYDTYEEIHFFFIEKIQKGKKLKSNMNSKKS